MIVFYVVLLPGGVLLWLKANRPAGRALTPRELKDLDGILAPLTTKYAPQYWWFEAVDVGVRMCFCGLAVFLFPNSPVLRQALCLIVVTCCAETAALGAASRSLLASTRAEE